MKGMLCWLSCLFLSLLNGYSQQRWVVAQDGSGDFKSVQMALDVNKPIFVFDQPSNNWLKFDYDQNRFEKMAVFPKLTEHFAGVGTREINQDGINITIINIYNQN
jgi:hypothetical protein